MNSFFDKLSFKQKIIFGFSLLSVILIFGMGYMLLEFTNVSKLSANIIEKHQPVTRSATSALENSKSAANYLHKFLLDGEMANLSDYARSIDNMTENFKILSQYAVELNLNQNELNRAANIITELDKHVKDIERYNKSYEDNHPVINAAASILNPLALEYLGILNTMIIENANLSKSVLIQLSNMRHTWSQMLSSLRITLATRQAREFTNVRNYAEVNYEQLLRLKKQKIDFGIESLDDLEKIRNEYMKELEKVISRFNTTMWRMDAHIMIQDVMPLFDELNNYLEKLSNIQIEQAAKADRLLSSQLRKSQYTFITLLIVGLVSAFFISSFITRSLRKPLKQLVDATREVASGNLQAGLVVQGNDEVAYINHAFNEMVGKLYESQQALTTARDLAEHANMAKSQFLTRMSHELRTPLNAILGFAQLLEMKTSKNMSSDEHEYVRNILKSGWHLLELVEEVLDLSQIETNTVLVHKEDINLVPLLHECIEIIRPMVVEHHQELVIDIAEVKTCLVYIDPLRFKQIILNLLSNAVKFNTKGGKVKIHCISVEDDYIRISVCDDGDGLSKEQQVIVFDAFQRFDADDRAIGGTGIGLNITKNLVELMGGEIGVTSEKGQGCCFWVEFMLKTGKSESYIAKEVHQTAIIQDNHKHTLLYIEDDAYNLELVREILSVLRPEITLFEAKNAEEGIEIAIRERPHLILMDLNLPGMSGQDALENLRLKSETANIPIVAISADAVKDTITKSRLQGFKNYITKPIKVSNFIEVVDSIFQNNS